MRGWKGSGGREAVETGQEDRKDLGFWGFAGFLRSGDMDGG